MSSHVAFLFPTIENVKWFGTPEWMSAPVVHNSDTVVFEISNLQFGDMLNNQPVSQNPEEHDKCFKLPSFADDFYNRILIEPNVINVGNLINEQFHEINVFNGYFDPKILENLIFENVVGINLSGSAVGTSWGPLESKSYQLTVLMDGPPIIDSTLSFDWYGIADDIAISVVGVRIIMLPFQATVPWKESLEWKTNVLTTNDGNEQRIKLRKSPRQFIEAEYPVANDKGASAVNMINGWIGRLWAIGIWSETQNIGNLLNGRGFILCDTTTVDFRTNGMVLIWESDTNNEVLEIESMTDTQINFKHVTSGIYSNAIVMPVRMGMPKGGVISRSSNGYNSSLSVNYAITDNLFINSDVPPQYLNEDIYWETSLIGDSEYFNEQIKTRQDEVDYETGVVDYYAPWVNSKRSRNVSFLNDGPLECWIFKKWLHRRVGRLRPYWLPTFEENLRIKQTGLVGSYITVHADNYKNLGLAHNHIAIKLGNNAWEARLVTGISDSSIGFINIAIDSPLFVDASEIQSISFLTLHRLDTDMVDINWIGNSINECSLRILEIKP